MIKLTIQSLIILLFTAACSSSTEPSQNQNRPPLFVKEIKAEQSGSVSALRYPETLKAYSVGRRIDSSDPSLMYEGGILYRIENDSAWNLQPGLPEKTPFNNSNTQKYPDSQEALKAEIEVKANEQRAIYRYLKEASDKAAGQIDALKISSQLSRKLLEQNKVLKEKLLQSQSENKQLQADLETLKKQIQSLLQFYQQKESHKSKFRRTHE